MKNKVIAVLALVLVLAMTAGCTAKEEAVVESETVTINENAAAPTTEVTSEPEIDPNAMTLESIQTKGRITSTGKSSTEDFGGITANKYTFDSMPTITFYTFNSVEDAESTFEYIKSKVLMDTTETDNTVVGQRAEAIGLPYIQFYYLTGNMIVANDDFIGDPGSDKGPSDKQKADNDTLHETILNYW